MNPIAKNPRKYLIEARAKLNLYLDIVSRRQDGYHELETVMQSVSLSDIADVSISAGEGRIAVSCDSPSIPAGKKNIACKAAERFFEVFGERADIDIHLTKRIPSGAGMGGGSADAAAVIAALGDYFGAPKDILLKAAAKTGADVPFCLLGGTKLCRGIGELMTEAKPVAEPFFLVIKPRFSCATAEAYKKYDENPIPPRGALKEFLSGTAAGDFSKMYNIFEPLYADKRLEEIKSSLLESGAQAALLTGSGAAVFGIFSTEQAAEKASRGFSEFSAVCSPCGCGIRFIER